MTTSSNATLTTVRDDIGLFFESLDLASIQAGFIGFQLAPAIETQWKLGQYSYLSTDQSLQKFPSADRTPQGGFNRLRNNFSRASYEVENHGLEEQVDNDQYAQYLGMIDSYLIAAGRTRHGVLEDHEKRVIEKVNAVSAVTVAGADQWDEATADVPLWFEKQKRAFRLQCGVMPNALCIDATAFGQLALNPYVLEAAGRGGGPTYRDSLEFNGGMEMKKAAVAAAIGVNEIIIANAVENTAAQPKAASLGVLFPEDKAVLFRKDTSDSTESTQWLRTIHWSGNGSRVGCVFEEYEEPQTDSRVLRNRMDDVVQVINSNAVMVFDAVIDLSIFS